MFGLRKTIGSVILAVVFLALASLATFFYNADQKQKEDLTNNNLIKASGEALGTIVGVSETVSDVNLQKNIGFGKTIADYASRVDWKGLISGTGAAIGITNTKISPETEINQEVTTNQENNFETDALDTGINKLTAIIEENTTTEKTGFWSKLSSLAKKEWADSQKPETGEMSEIVVPSEGNYLNYQKTETGAEIIFQSKSGTAYKLPLPFKFLSNF